MVAAGGAAAAAAAAKATEEEEEMTSYDPKDLADDVEFKILRSATGGFRNPDWLRQVLAEEAKAGWTLVEKFDDSRVRLKRPRSAARDDAKLGFDARRTYVGISQARLAAYIVVGSLLVTALIAGIAIVTAISLAPPRIR